MRTMIDLPPLLGRARALAVGIAGGAILSVIPGFLLGLLLLLLSLLRLLRLLLLRRAGVLLFRLRGFGGIGVVAILLGILRRRHNRGRSSIRFLCGGSLCSLNHRMGLCRSGRRGLRIGTAHGQAHSRRRRVGASVVAEAWRARAGHWAGDAQPGRRGFRPVGSAEDAVLLLLAAAYLRVEVRTRRRWPSEHTPHRQSTIEARPRAFQGDPRLRPALRTAEAVAGRPSPETHPPADHSTRPHFTTRAVSSARSASARCARARPPLHPIQLRVHRTLRRVCSRCCYLAPNPPACSYSCPAL